MVKNPPAMQETWVQSLGSKVPGRTICLPTPILLPGESPWTKELGRLQFKCHKESDMTEQLNTHKRIRKIMTFDKRTHGGYLELK